MGLYFVVYLIRNSYKKSGSWCCMWLKRHHFPHSLITILTLLSDSKEGQTVHVDNISDYRQPLTVYSLAIKTHLNITFCSEIN